MSALWAVFGFAFPFTLGAVMAWLWTRNDVIALKSRTDGAIYLCQSVEARRDLHPQTRVVVEEIRRWLTPTVKTSGEEQA